MYKILKSKTLFALAACLTFSTVTANTNKKNHEVYIWGNGNYQARPDALLQFKNFIPKKITNLPKNLVSLHFGLHYEAGIDKDGRLYIWDKHQVDSNYHENNHDALRNNITLLMEDVETVRFTSGYIWVLTKNHKVYQWKIINQSNHSPRPTLSAKRQVLPFEGTIQIETGTLNGRGQVYAMGDDTFGQCGQANTDRSTAPPFDQFRVTYPSLVVPLKQIQKGLPPVNIIKSGMHHNLAIDRMGNLFGWGSNSNLQLSHEDQFSKMSNPLICSYKPLKIGKNLDGKVINKIEAGGQFNIICVQDQNTSDKQVFSFGSNLKGQLGIDEIRHFKDISKINKLSNYQISIPASSQKVNKVSIDQISCGTSHCLALLNIGYVMEWGDNEYGQMGNQKRSSSMVPVIQRFFNDKKVIGVFAGHNCSGVIVECDQKQG